MAFGLKVKNVNFSKAYTFEELLEEMKKTTFDAGEPFIVKHGLTNIIAFPPLDNQNQVWVLSWKGNNGGAKWSVQLSHEIAGDFGNMAKNMVLDKLTGGIFGLGGMVSKNSKAGEAMVEDTLAKLTALNL